MDKFAEISELFYLHATATKDDLISCIVPLEGIGNYIQDRSFDGVENANSIESIRFMNRIKQYPTTNDLYYCLFVAEQIIDKFNSQRLNESEKIILKQILFIDIELSFLL